MLFYMDGNDLANFTDYVRPTAAELTPGLTSSLTDAEILWLKETYAKAYITFSISRMPKAVDDQEVDDSIKFKGKFAEAEQKKIWYYFMGNVRRSFHSSMRLLLKRIYALCNSSCILAHKNCLGTKMPRKLSRIQQHQ